MFWGQLNIPNLKSKDDAESIIVIVKFKDNKIDFKTSSDDRKQMCIADGIYAKDK